MVFNDKLLDIIQKYSTSNQSLLNIKNGLDLISTGLDECKKNISQIITEINDSDDIDEVKSKELNTDLILIKQTKKTVNDILVPIVPNCQPTTPVPPKQSYEIPRISLKVTTNVHDCPDCYKTQLILLRKTSTSFKEFDNNGEYLCTHTVDTLYCPSCGRNYIFRDNFLKFANLHDISHTNVDFTYAYCLPKIIEYYDFLVISNVQSCSNSEHHIRDIIAKIKTIAPNGVLIDEEINAGYCQECDRFIILKSNYAELKGVPVCKVIDDSPANKVGGGHSEFNNPPIGNDTLFTQRGYNVNCLQNLPSLQRQGILREIISHQECSKAEVCSYLDALISRGEKRPNWENAVNRWKEDRSFVDQIELSNLPVKNVRSLTIK